MSFIGSLLGALFRTNPEAQRRGGGGGGGGGGSGGGGQASGKEALAAAFIQDLASP